jgi:hypothetical protein
VELPWQGPCSQPPAASSGVQTDPSPEQYLCGQSRSHMDSKLQPYFLHWPCRVELWPSTASFTHCCQFCAVRQTNTVFLQCLAVSSAISWWMCTNILAAVDLFVWGGSHLPPPAVPSARQCGIVHPCNLVFAVGSTVLCVERAPHSVDARACMC